MSIHHIPAGKCPEHGATTEAIFRCVVAFKRDHGGDSPTAREIAAGVGVRSTAVVHSALAALEREGKIHRGRYGQARAIEIVGARYVLPEEGPEKV